MSESRLARQIAAVFRHERDRRQLTRQALAGLAGLSQGTEVADPGAGDLLRRHRQRLGSAG